jgi:tetratricopeptide (TPR) repeat protein
MSAITFKAFSLLTRVCVVGFFCILCVGYSQDSQTVKDAPPRELSDKVSQSIDALTKLQDAGNKWDEVLIQVDALLASAQPVSFDTAFLSQLKVQALLAKSDYKNAIPPLETAISLSERYKFFGDKDLELLWLLAQLYAQEAAQDNNPDNQKSKYAKAYDTLRRWLDRTPKPNADAHYFAATILYNQAVYNAKEIDRGLMDKALSEAHKGLLLAIKPKQEFYTLLMAMYQQIGDYRKSAEFLELLVREYPKNKSYWQYLLNAYIQMDKEGFTRAILTIERAQSNGLLNENRDNFALVSLHVNSEQFSHAIDLLEAGLRNGSLDSDQKTWEILASCYQQLRKDDKALTTFKEAIKLFPNAGSLDLQVGNIYYVNNKYSDALTYMKSAVQKTLDRNQQIQAYSYIAYLGLDLKKFDDAKVAAEKALQLDPNSSGAKDLLRAVNEAILERDSQLAASTKTG